MKKEKIRIKLWYIVVVCCFCSCSHYLDIKPDNSFDIPNSLQDLKGLLDNSEIVMNLITPGLGETASDSYYMNEDSWASMPSERDRLLYLWQPYSPVAGQWTGPYQAVLYANTVLEYLPTIRIGEHQHAMAEELKGTSLFYRAYHLFNLLHVFSLPYDPNSDNKQLGVVLRTKASLDEPLKRATTKECYDFIVGDLERSISLLPERQILPTRPSKAAAYAELARVYLVMSEFEQAGLYADSALMIRSDLLDYQLEVTSTASLPFSKWNKEVIFDASMNGGIPLAPARRRVSGFEYENYEEADIRKTAFFSVNNLNEVLFKGNYNGMNSSQLFCGTTTAEMYLIRAESRARQGRLREASEDVNVLRSKRWKQEDFSPVGFNNQYDLVSFIKEERRRELIFRGQRWPDMRRYVVLGEYNETMVRTAEGITYTMTPDDILKYTYKLPNEVIDNGILLQND